MCMVWYARLFGVLRENALCAHDITYAGHYEKSLLHVNDSRCYLRKMKITITYAGHYEKSLLHVNDSRCYLRKRNITSDWIGLLCRLLKRHTPIFLDFFSKSLRFWYHKNRHIFVIIILKFHALIPLHLEENCKNSPILLTWWLPQVKNHVLAGFAVYSLKTVLHYSKETVSKQVSFMGP